MKRIFPLLLILATLAGCLNKVERVDYSYYVLDYQKATENPALRRAQPFPKSLEVLNAQVNRTYARNQLVVRDNFSRIRYLPYDLWASRLSEAIPNITVQRLRAYKIFQQVDRTGDVTPDYYLETNILNLEKIASRRPKAYLRVEYSLRDSRTQKTLLSYKAERYEDLYDRSTVYLIQTYNEMLMKETDVLAARCALFLGGIEVGAEPPQTALSPLEDFVYTEAAEAALTEEEGELLVALRADQHSENRYALAELDSEGETVERYEGVFNEPRTLKAGSYRVTIGENQEIAFTAEIKPKSRTVIAGKWAELVVKIIDQSQNRVRLSYDVWVKDPEEFDYYLYGTDSSIGDDDLGQPDKVWIMKPGTYMVKLGGGAWNDLENFTTANLNQGDSEVLTVVTNPTGEGNLLVGAGILGESQPLYGRPLVHKGAIHGYINLASNNNDGRGDPNYNLNLTGQLENNLDVTLPLRHFSARSSYDLGLNSSTDSDLMISADSYSLKNVFLFTPWERSEDLRNFSFYARGDVATHFFDEHLNFETRKNLILLAADGDTLDTVANQKRLKTKSAFFPLRLKEGTGITYRWVVSPKVTLSLRGGYGWQQVYNPDNYSFVRSGAALATPDSLLWDVYQVTRDQHDHGIESTLVLSAINLLRFLSVNSTFDVLFPMDKSNAEPRFESENRFNLRLYRNVSLDLKLNLQYDKPRKDWVVYDFGSYLRLSLYY